HADLHPRCQRAAEKHCAGTSSEGLGQAETFAKFKLPPEKSDFRHSRAGGNPDGNIEVLIKQILECQASGFPLARE
ncbi:hypothetical protein, partial [Neisseria dentiae]|uniref:hypothetical protein n=1 Tax=Neisseria dentiae TaxID=194197 RepID=UPI0035A0F37E